MRCGRLLVLSTTVAAVSFGCQRAPDVDQQAEAAAIRALSRQWLEAINAQDLEACLEFYAADAIEMQPNAPAMVGLPAIREWFETGLLQPGISHFFEPDTIEVAVSGVDATTFDRDRTVEVIYQNHDDTEYLIPRRTVQEHVGIGHVHVTPGIIGAFCNNRRQYAAGIVGHYYKYSVNKERNF